MVAFALLVAAFLLVGFTVLAFAFASGRRRTASASGSGGGALLYTGVALVVVGIGLALPLGLLIKNADSADVSAVGGVDLTAAQAHGRELFATNCATCHTLKASNSTGAIGPNLDVLRPADGLVENAILVGRAQGNGNMPAGLLTGDDAKDVAAYVAAVAGRDDVSATATDTTAASAGGEAPASTTPAASGGSTQAAVDAKQIFTENCASCHTMKAAGATGQVGPNLDKELGSDPASATLESIVDPNKEIIPGYQKGIMPADFATKLTKQQLAALVAYIYNSTHK